MRKIQKLLLNIVLILISLVLIMYISLCMFVKSKESIIEENFLLENTNVYLAEEQLEIASFIFTKDKNPKFKKYPLIIDFFSFKNQIARFVSSDFVDNSLSSLDNSFQIFATSRRLVRKTNYKICYNYIFSKMYFGNDVYGLKEACLHYFGKNYNELDTKEFICICLITTNPSFYDFYEHKERLYGKVDDIYNKFYE